MNVMPQVHQFIFMSSEEASEETQGNHDLKQRIIFVQARRKQALLDKPWVTYVYGSMVGLFMGIAVNELYHTWD
jgi:hypothetical protein